MAEEVGVQTGGGRRKAFIPDIPRALREMTRRESREDAARIRKMQLEQEPKHRGHGIAKQAERRAKALGPGGRQKKRVDAVPHGKESTMARGKLQFAKYGKSSHPVKGSPKAKRRIANREKQPPTVH